MSHRRAQPVLGFPQAFRDAGVGSVVSPCQPVLRQLSPYFAGHFHLTLRFAPVEHALRRTLVALERYWGVIVEDDASLQAALSRERMHGDQYPLLRPVDFDYRHYGTAGYHGYDGPLGRVWARVRWWWRLARWEFELRKLRQPGSVGSTKDAGLPSPPVADSVETDGPQ